MGTVAASLIVLGNDWSTGAISTGTFTTDPCICNCQPRGKLYNDMNGILKDINLSSNAYRHSSGDFVGMKGRLQQLVLESYIKLY